MVFSQSIPMQCCPTWFATRYAKEEVSFCFVALAILHWCANTLFHPVDTTLRALRNGDITTFEIMAIVEEILFLAWLWMGDGSPDRLLPKWGWTLAAGLLLGTHLYAIERRDIDLRVMCLLFNLVWYGVLSYVALRTRHFVFGNVFLLPMIPAGGVTILTLRLGVRGGG